MDTHAHTPELIKLQGQYRYFLDLALECNQQCISTYDDKKLNDTERSCVETCFKKYKTWNDVYYNTTQASKP